MSVLRGSAIFCDQIRKEDNGKEFLIGVYTHTLLVSKLPTLLPLSVRFVLDGLASGDHKLRVELEAPGGAKAGLTGNMSVARPNEPSSVSVPPVSINLGAEGFLVCRVAVDDEELCEAGRVLVGLKKDLPDS